jgi:phage repressor protein C with HTH and peptisase S24 domain
MREKITFGDRVRAERERRKWTQQTLADEASRYSPERKLTQDDISKIENRRAKKSIHAPAISKALGFDYTWAVTGAELSTSPEPIATDDSRWADVRSYAIAVGLGSSGPESDEYAEASTLKFRRDSLRRKGLSEKRLAVWEAKGDSMKEIQNGDAVLFDESDTVPKDDELYVIRVGSSSEHQCKKAMILDGIVYFVATNPDGAQGWKKPKRMDDRKNPIHIVGRARWIGRWLS